MIVCLFIYDLFIQIYINIESVLSPSLCLFYCVVECYPCDNSMYCMTPGLNQSEGPCAAGYYCLGEASTPTPTDGTTGNVCPQGRYCVEGLGYDGLCHCFFSSLLLCVCVYVCVCGGYVLVCECVFVCGYILVCVCVCVCVCVFVCVCLYVLV